MAGLFAFSKMFPDEQSCIEYYEKQRWGNKVVSPFDPTSKVYKRKDGTYRCSKTGRNFDVKTGTMFARTKLPLRYWFYAMFMFLSHKRGVSSCQLARNLGVTQKTAWSMLHKIREYLDCENAHQLDTDAKSTKHLSEVRTKTAIEIKRLRSRRDVALRIKFRYLGCTSVVGNSLQKWFPIRKLQPCRRYFHNMLRPTAGFIRMVGITEI